jgi:hypothetical protein
VPPRAADATVVFVAHASGDVFRALAASGMRVPQGLFAGACGYIEGGIHFQGAGGAFIASDDWSAARDYALRLAEALG